MIKFVDDHRDRFGVAPICRVLTEHVRDVQAQIARLAPTVDTRALDDPQHVRQRWESEI